MPTPETDPLAPAPEKALGSQTAVIPPRRPGEAQSMGAHALNTIVNDIDIHAATPGRVASWFAGTADLYAQNNGALHLAFLIPAGVIAGFSGFRAALAWIGYYKRKTVREILKGKETGIAHNIAADFKVDIVSEAIILNRNPVKDKSNNIIYPAYHPNYVALVEKNGRLVLTYSPLTDEQISFLTNPYEHEATIRRILGKVTDAAILAEDAMAAIRQQKLSVLTPALFPPVTPADTRTRWQRFRAFWTQENLFALSNKAIEAFNHFRQSAREFSILEAASKFLEAAGKFIAWWKKWENIKSAITNVKDVLFNYAMWYWLVWATGAGIKGLAITGGIAFGSAWIGFGVPALITLGFYALKLAYQYRHRNDPPYDANAVKLVEALTRIQLSNHVANEKINKAKQSIGFIPDANPTTETQSWEALAEAKDLLTTKENLNKKYPINQEASQSFIQKYKPNTRLSNFRVGIMTAIGFVSGFIIGFLIQWPITDLLSNVLHVHGLLAFNDIAPLGLTGTALVPFVMGAVVPIVISLVMAIIFAKYAYNDAIGKKRAQEESFADLVQPGSDYKASVVTLVNNLEIEVKQRRLAVADAIKKCREAKISVSFDPSQIQVRVDNHYFMDQFHIDAKNSWQKAWTLFKKALKRYSPGIGGAGSGVLMVRIIFGMVATLASLGLVTGSTPTSLLVIIAAAVCGTVWAGVRVFQYIDQRRNVDPREKLLEQVSSYKATLESEIAQLKTMEIEVKTLINEAPAKGSEHPADEIVSPLGAKAGTTISSASGASGASGASTVTLATNGASSEEIDGEADEHPDFYRPSTPTRK